MNPLAHTATDDQIIRLVDDWVRLLEAENYAGAHGFIQSTTEMGWTPELIREVIKAYGRNLHTQKVTLEGKPTDISQRKEVTRFDNQADARLGYVWYDLNIDGYASDLTATFDITATQEGLTLVLDDIHVM